jgi:hypothetical protein
MLIILQRDSSEDLPVGGLLPQCGRCICGELWRERAFPLFGPQFSRVFTVLAPKLLRHPDHRAEDGGAVVAGQFYDPRLGDEAAEFGQMPEQIGAICYEKI